MSARNYVESLKNSLSLRGIATLLGLPTGGDIRCLWHPDKTPSCHIYDDHLYCFGCKQRFDVFDLVMAVKGLSFAEAVTWLRDKAGDVPRVRKTKPKVKSNRFVPRTWVDLCYNQLDHNRREGLYRRLISDKTIRLHRLGWNPRTRAYTIPLWDGYPARSSIAALQYRSTPDSPLMRGRPWKYRLEAGYYHPCMINRYLINNDLVVIFVGTFDALLAGQDLIPAISPINLTAFAKNSSGETEIFREELAPTNHKILVADSTPSEWADSRLIADNLGASLTFFPHDWGVKDYTEYRMAGGTPAEFMETIIMPFYDADLGVVSPPREGWYSALNQGEMRNIDLLLRVLVQESLPSIIAVMEVIEACHYPVAYVSQAIQMRALHGNFEGAERLSTEEWEQFCEEVSKAGSYRKLMEALSGWNKHIAALTQEKAALGVF